MTHQLELSDPEWELLIELLEQERSELPSEVRHSRLANMRDGLRQREETVQKLLERMRAATV
jgi:hypothetical protein